jgi:hypothetical protein
MLPDAASPPKLIVSAPSSVSRALVLAILAVAAGAGLAQILTADVLYTANRWPEKQPPHTPFFSANDRSRWCTVWSLVERRTFQIDEIIQAPGWDSIDKVRVDGHFYSTKPPLLPVLAAGVYAAEKWLWGADLLAAPHTPARGVLVLFNLVPWIVALACLGSVARRLAPEGLGEPYVVLVAAFGTLLSPFLITFNNHSVAAASVAFTLAGALPLLEGARLSAGRLALVGCCAAWTTCNELPACVFSAAIGLLCLWKGGFRGAAWFAVGAAVPTAAFFYTTWLATGSPLPFYTRFGTEAYNHVHEGIPSYWTNPDGLDRSAEPWWTYLWHCTFGHHGIFSLSPILLLALISWSRPHWNRTAMGRIVGGFSVAMTVWVLAFYLGQTKNYNYGGNTAGLRWAFWLIPLWVLSILPALERFQLHRHTAWIAPCLLGISVFSAAYPSRNPWQPPWLQTWMESRGWVDYRSVAERPPSRRTWLGDWPSAEKFGAGAWVSLVAESPGGVPQTMRIVALDKPMNKRGDRTLEITRRSGGSRDAVSVDIEQVEINAASFDAFKPPGEFVRSAGNSTDNARRLKLLQGMPHAAEYRIDPIVRYVKLPFRPRLAYACRVAVAHVQMQREVDGPLYNYRRRVWWSDEVPFGVVQLEDTIRDPSDNTIVARQLWTLSGHAIPVKAASPENAGAPSGE